MTVAKGSAKLQDIGRVVAHFFKKVPSLMNLFTFIFDLLSKSSYI